MKPTATKIVQTLQNNGFKAYFVGGCVRDMILGLEPQDIDIATDARPLDIAHLFEKTYPIGKHFGVVLIQENNHHFEVATFRSDSGYSDGRRPDFVTYSDPSSDALRRDFTLNGIFYDPIKDQYLDFVEGMSDLKRGILRFIGDPDMRIREDFLRILRAIRFKNRFNLVYDTSTQKALQKHSSLIVDISVERIIDEMNKILAHKSRKKALEELWGFGILPIIIPELKILEKTPQPPLHHQEGNVLRHTFLVLDALSDEECREVYWAALFHDAGKGPTAHYEEGRIHFPNHSKSSVQIADNFCRKMNFSRFSRKKITWLVEHHHLFDHYEDMKLATRLHYFDHPFFDELLVLAKADLLGSIPQTYETQNEALKKLHLIEENYAYAHTNKILPSYRKELITGKDILDILKIDPGKKVGEIKEKIRFLQLEGEIKTREEALEYLHSFSF